MLDRIFCCRQLREITGGRPGLTLDIITCVASVEIGVGFLLGAIQFYRHDHFDINPLVSRAVVFLRCLTFVWCLVLFVFAFSAQEASAWTVQQFIQMRSNSMKVVAMGIGLLFLHLLDLILVVISGLAAASSLGQGMVAALCILLPADLVLALTATYVFYHPEWRRAVEIVAEEKTPLDLESCSCTIQWDSEEVCCICLSNPVEGEVVSTLPCGHMFHRNCVECWLSEGESRYACPFRCPAQTAETPAETQVQQQQGQPLPERIGSAADEQAGGEEEDGDENGVIRV